MLHGSETVPRAHDPALTTAHGGGGGGGGGGGEIQWPGLPCHIWPS